MPTREPAFLAGLVLSTLLVAALAQEDPRAEGGMKPALGEGVKDIRPVRVEGGAENDIRFFAISRDGKLVAYRKGPTWGTPDHLIEIAVCDVAKGKVVARLARPPHYEQPDAAVFSPDGKRLAVGYLHARIWLWDVTTGKVLHPFEQDSKSERPWMQHPFMFSPDGKFLISTGVRYLNPEKGTFRVARPGEFVVWDVTTGKVVRRVEHGSAVAFYLSDDGRTLVAEHMALVKRETIQKLDTWFTTRTTVRVWDFTTGKDLAGVGAPVETRYHERFGPDPRPGARLREVGAVAHGCGVRISPTGRAMIFPRFPVGGALDVARCGKGNGLCLLDWTTGKELHRFTDFRDGLYGFGLSANGNTLAASGGIGKKSTLLVWDVSRWRQQALRPRPDLSGEELAALWSKLGDDDPLEAYRAMRRLAASPRQALAFLRDRLQPIREQKPDFATLLAQLDDAKFPVRRKAEEALRGAGDEAVPHIEKALKRPPSAEARQRMESLLKEIQQARLPAPATRRLLWCVELLEQLGTPEAGQLLDRLAQGSPAAWATREARAALGRLTGR